MRVYLDNGALDGFLEPFADGRAACGGGCDDCAWCGAAAEKALEIDPGWRKSFLAGLKAAMDRGLALE